MKLHYLDSSAWVKRYVSEIGSTFLSELFSIALYLARNLALRGADAINRYQHWRYHSLLMAGAMTAHSSAQIENLTELPND